MTIREYLEALAAGGPFERNVTKATAPVAGAWLAGAIKLAVFRRHGPLTPQECARRILPELDGILATGDDWGHRARIRRLLAHHVRAYAVGPLPGEGQEGPPGRSSGCDRGAGG